MSAVEEKEKEFKDKLLGKEGSVKLKTDEFLE